MTESLASDRTIAEVRRLRINYAVRFIRHDLFRLALTRHHGVHGHLSTATQSGSHWLNHMLSEVICEQYGVPRPESIDECIRIGSKTHPAALANIPKLVWSHHSPSPLVHSRPARMFLRLPRYVVLVRDIRAALVSRYEKRKEELRTTFSESLRDQPVFGNVVKWDILKRISFCNAWGRVVEAAPDRVCIVRYEGLQHDAAAEVERVWRFLELPITNPGMFARAAAASTKDRMAGREDTAGTRKVVRRTAQDPLSRFEPADREYFTECCRQFLRHPFGYDYEKWTPAASVGDYRTTRAA